MNGQFPSLTVLCGKLSLSCHTQPEIHSVSATLLSLLLVSASAAPFDGSPAVELRYSGTLSPVGRGNSGAAVKRFTLYYLVSKGKTAQRDVAFVFDEQGAGSRPWPERFGRITLDVRNRPIRPSGISLLLDHAGTLYPVSIRNPFFGSIDKVKPGATWNEGRSRYKVGGLRKVHNYDCWQIELSNRFGHVQSAWFQKTSFALVSLRQRVFVGRGDQYQLAMDLGSMTPLSDKQFARIKQPLAMLIDLQAKLNRKPGTTTPTLTRAQLSAVEAMASPLTRAARGTPFSSLAAVISRDTKSQLQRDEEIGSLTKKFVGTASPALKLRIVNGTKIEPRSLTGKIVVLHFWTYRRSPLVEPYGQVGYLDFHNHKFFKRNGVKVFGIAVDSRFGSSAKQSAATRSVRKLQEFMNLVYPIAVDDGTLLRRFGDPKRLGAKLPLWVVIAPNGRIVHYKVGFYQRKGDEGLPELRAVVDKLIRQAGSRKKTGSNR